VKAFVEMLVQELLYPAAMKIKAGILVALIAAGCGSSSDSPSTSAAKLLCNKVCSCSSDCTVATIDTNGEAKEPLHFGTEGSCEGFYSTFFAEPDGGVATDPAACSSEVPSAVCATAPSDGSHFLVPPADCRAHLTVTPDAS
jgi:hypothetical protein